MRRLVALTAALALLLAPVAGCAGAIPLVKTVASVIAEVASWVDLIESQSTSASEAGLLPPDIARRITAVRAAVQRLNDAARLGPAAYEAAVREFEALYAELVQVVGPLGVRTAAAGGRLAAAPPGTVAVPPAAELGARLREQSR